MQVQDRKIVCQVCGKVFVLSARAQIEMRNKGFTNLPRRCPSCRKSGKGRQHPGGRSHRQLYHVKCSFCHRFFDSPQRAELGVEILCPACKVIRGGEPRRRRRR